MKWRKTENIKCPDGTNFYETTLSNYAFRKKDEIFHFFADHHCGILVQGYLVYILS